ncbi:hypothetical protein [Streptomyces sp. Go-475]|uniref:hypothetical protein n=1 Tax=Streptomyces sp. Go-475 TaxID=2072505 RepID=UPI000DF00043|nr:hypothetical protein [Streptomyces sp. Go-475]
MREIRDRIRSPAEEYQANHPLREKHRAVLEAGRSGRGRHRGATRGAGPCSLPRWWAAGWLTADDG